MSSQQPQDQKLNPSPPTGRLSAERIERLIRAAERVAQGDLTIRIEDEREDEIGRLAQVFNQMISHLEFLHRSRDLLSRTMSPAVRHSLLEKGLDFRGITQTVSILFVDIRGFTRLAEHVHSEQLIFFLNDYYTTIANQVHSGGGIIGKYGGDSILAIFGAPEPEQPESSSTKAVLTALALQEAIDQLSQRWSVLGFAPIGVGMGVAIGEAVAGPIGSTEQFEYTVIGDAVNLAARLQGLTRNVIGFDVILAREVYEALDEKVKGQIMVMDYEAYNNLSEQEKIRRPIMFVDLGEVLVKGRRGATHVYAIPGWMGPQG
jgi:class 3 adenylate cyclase